MKGLVRKLIAECPGQADVFNHAHSGNEKVPCQAAVLNALDKAGMTL